MDNQDRTPDQGSFSPRSDTSADPPHDPLLRVTWPASLLESDTASSVRAFANAVHGFAKRLAPEARARFTLALDSALYSMQGEAAIAASDHDGLHPKHRLTRYHDFFIARVRPGERVLDLGCGVGALARALATRAGAIVTGMDWSEKNLERAVNLFRGDLRVEVPNQTSLNGPSAPPPSFYLGDITTHRAPGHFDAVILSNVLEHLRERPRLLACWRTWYTPSRFLIRVPAFDRDWRVPYKLELGVEHRLDLTHEIEYTREALIAELAAAGLRVLELHAAWGEYWLLAAP